MLFEAPLACGLLGNFVQAASGGALYRKSSFLVDSLGKPVFAEHVTLHEDPYLPRGQGSSPFDEEGVRGMQRDVVADGVLNGYFLSTYSARKLGMRSTGNAGGSHNLRSGRAQRAARRPRRMLRKLGTRPVRDRADGAGRQLRDRRLLARRQRLLGRGRRDPLSGAGDHDRRQPARHVPRTSSRSAPTVVRGSKISGSVLIDGMTIGGS